MVFTGLCFLSFIFSNVAAMNKLLSYIAIFVITVLSILLVAWLKLGFDFAIIVSVFAFVVLMAVKGNE